MSYFLADFARTKGAKDKKQRKKKGALHYTKKLAKYGAIGGGLLGAGIVGQGAVRDIARLAAQRTKDEAGRRIIGKPLIGTRRALKEIGSPAAKATLLGGAMMGVGLGSSGAQVGAVTDLIRAAKRRREKNKKRAA